MDIEIKTDYYEGVHKTTPKGPKKGVWKFQPPKNLGRRPWHFVDMTYAKAKREIVKELGERIPDGPFYLLP